jgi:signal transduction histidine kinase
LIKRAPQQLIEYHPAFMMRISTKLVLLVLAAVGLPFLSFAIYVDQAVTLGFTKQVTQQALLGLSGDLAGRLDHQFDAAREGLELLAGQPFLGYLLESTRRRNLGDATEDPSSYVEPVRYALAERQRVGGLYEFLALIDAEGQLVLAGLNDSAGTPHDPKALAELKKHDFKTEPWFAKALAGEPVSINQHKSDLYPRSADEVSADFLGFVEPVGQGSVEGVVFALVSWQPFQELIQSPVVRETFRGLVRPGEDPSPYAWIWSADADVILAHQDVSLYGTRITEDLGLGIMTQAVRANPDGWGLYPPYEFRGVPKTAAFKRCAGPAEGGFGWVVGVGIDDEDMYASSQSLRRILRLGTLGVFLVVMIWTMVIAKRITSPIHALQNLTRRVAEGDLKARLEPSSSDELGALTRDFNAMTERLAEQRETIVKAEKDAAWREMARQIAHDIKNPLTPIKISVDLLRRARAESPERFAEMFEPTMELMERQIQNLRGISQDFYEFTGGRKSEPEVFDVAELIDEVLALHKGWAGERGVTLTKRGHGQVFVDRAKLRRVLENVMTNAMHAAPDGGSIEVVATANDGEVCVELTDDGPGISEEVRAHLFEPYFTTRSEGTGLGLAIARRVVEEMEGTIDLAPRADGRAGTTARVLLPAANGAR